MPDAYAKAVRHARKDAGWTKKKLARKLGMTKRELLRVEKGKARFTNEQQRAFARAVDNAWPGVA